MHGDCGPFNTIFRLGMPVAFIDWDFCRPGRRLGELAYMAWQFCLIASRKRDTENEARRLAFVREGYGRFSGEELVGAILASQDQHIAKTVHRIALAATPQARRNAREVMRWDRRCRVHTERYAESFLRALR